MDKRNDRILRISRLNHLLERQTGKAVRPYRADGYVNLMNRYGTSKDVTENYYFESDADVPDDVLTTFYEGNGIFAKIIDTPAEEAVKHGFEIEGLADDNLKDFYVEGLDELDWEETAITALKWTRLYGGAIAVMLINDGRGLEEPLDWRHIKSIDDIRVYERAVVQPDIQSMFSYDPQDPFRTRGSRLGMPEYYTVFSKYGNFTVHESRCLVFQNGKLPESTTSQNYELWGIPEYMRIQRAIRDAEVAHGSATKLLDRSVQAVYKMKDLSAELATEEGESMVLRRLQTIDMARGLLNSIVIDSEGEDYDFRQFTFTGVSDVIDSTCNFLSAVTSIPQTILFGRSPAGMNATGHSDFENYYNYVERIQKKNLRGNLRYLLSVLFAAGVATGEVDEVPKINITFNPLWSLSEEEQVNLDSLKANVEQTRANTANIYSQMGVIDPTEVRRKLAESDEFDIETMLDDYEDEEELFANMPEQQPAGPEGMPGAGAEGQPQAPVMEAPQQAVSGNGEPTKAEKMEEAGEPGSAPGNAPAATKIPQDMTKGEKEKAEEDEPDEERKDTEGHEGGVGVIVVKDGKILCGTRLGDNTPGTLCGPGGHIEKGEEPIKAAFRETEEEFGISPKNLILIGRGRPEPETGFQSYIYLCDDYEGDLECLDGEMAHPTFYSLEQLELLRPSMFQPFADSIDLINAIFGEGDYPSEYIESTETENIEKNSAKSENSLDISTVCDIVSLRNFILQLGLDREDAKAQREKGHWVTWNGTHLLLDNAQNIVKGPDHLIGRSFLELHEEAKGESKGKKGNKSQSGVMPYEKRMHWPEGFPDVAIHTNVTTLKNGANAELYERAKKQGSMSAARKLVNNCTKPDRLEEFATKYKDAIVVPIKKPNDEGSNRIPQAFALKLEQYGMQVDTDIVQMNKVGHTGAHQLDRLLSHSQFDGEVIEGQHYVLLDDVATSGGTLNDLRKYIESKGGIVDACTTLAQSQGGNVLAPKKETVKEVYDKFGPDIDYVIGHGGIGYDVRSLTERQCKYLVKHFKNIDAIRDFLSEAKKRGGTSGGSATGT